MIDLSATVSHEYRTIRALLMIVGIPVLTLILFAFSRRKKGLCVEQFGADACRTSPLTYGILAFAMFICFLGLVRSNRVSLEKAQ
jgi:hypothetical protein